MTKNVSKISKKCKKINKKDRLYQELAHRLGKLGYNELDQTKIIECAIRKLDLYNSLLEEKETHVRQVIGDYYSVGEENPSLNLKFEKEKKMEQAIAMLQNENLKLKEEIAELKKSK